MRLHVPTEADRRRDRVFDMGIRPARSSPPSHNPGPGRRGLPRRKAVPYRVMVPRPIRNLICPGRAVSVDRDILGAIRVMSPCMAMGQAVGTAAAMCIADHLLPRQLPVNTLRQQLKEQGAILEGTY